MKSTRYHVESESLDRNSSMYTNTIQTHTHCCPNYLQRWMTPHSQLDVHFGQRTFWMTWHLLTWWYVVRLFWRYTRPCWNFTRIVAINIVISTDLSDSFTFPPFTTNVWTLLRRLSKISSHQPTTLTSVAHGKVGGLAEGEALIEEHYFVHVVEQ